MKNVEGAALNAALAVELRLLRATGDLSVAKLQDLSGIHRDTIRRILNATRPITVIELDLLGAAMQFDSIDLLERAKSRASAVGETRRQIHGFAPNQSHRSPK